MRRIPIPFVASSLWLVASWPSAVLAGSCDPGWYAFESGPDQPNSRALAVYQEGTRTSLFVGGWFESAGGVPTGGIARWDGASWSALGNGPLSGRIITMLVFDDGTRDSLFVGGSTIAVPGGTPSGIMRWDGDAWHSIGTGVTGIVATIAVHQQELYAGGSFWLPAFGEHGPRNLAKWNGASWEPVGGGTNHAVSSLLSFDAGNGRALYITGFFSFPGPSVMRWDGDWSDSRGSWDWIRGELTAFDGGAGEDLYLAGLAEAGGAPVWGLFRWNGTDWDVIGTTDAPPHSASVWDDGAGPALYVGGAFSTVNNEPITAVARWNGDEWSGTGAEVLGASVAAALAGYDDGSGPALYAGGHFDRHGSTRYLARYRTCNHIEPCYANCDGSTSEPILTVDDFTCFINEFAAAQGLPPQQQIEHYANCDGSTTEPILTVDDFTCFVNEFAQGCP